MEVDNNNIKKNKPLSIRGIPLIAIVFPPLGLLMLLIAASTAAWFTHLFVCFSDDRWGFLIAGAIMFPIAIVHGVGIWFGAW